MYINFIYNELLFFLGEKVCDVFSMFLSGWFGFFEGWYYRRFVLLVGQIYCFGSSQICFGEGVYNDGLVFNLRFCYYGYFFCEFIV